MSSGIPDVLLSLVLSGGFLFFAILLLAGSVLVFFKSRDRKNVRRVCIVLILLCVLYLAMIAALAYLFGTGAGPGAAAP